MHLPAFHQWCPAISLTEAEGPAHLGPVMVILPGPYLPMAVATVGMQQLWVECLLLPLHCVCPGSGGCCAASHCHPCPSQGVGPPGPQAVPVRGLDTGPCPGVE